MTDSLVVTKQDIEIALSDPTPDAEQVVAAILQSPEWQPSQAIQVRGLLYADGTMEREIERLDVQQKEVAALFKAKRESLEARQAFIRRSIHAYIILFNKGEKVSWPDVGTAALAKIGDKLDIQDEGKTKAVLREIGADEAIKTVEEIDKRKLREIVQSRPSAFAEAARLIPQEKILKIWRK